MPFTCVVPNCEDKSSSRHRLPNSNKFLNRFNQWLEAIGNKNLKSADPVKAYTNYRICHNHFAPEYFSTNMYLKPNAVPTLLLPLPIVTMNLEPQILPGPTTNALSVQESVILETSISSDRVLNKGFEDQLSTPY